MLPRGMKPMKMCFAQKVYMSPGKRPAAPWRVIRPGEYQWSARCADCCRAWPSDPPLRMVISRMRGTILALLQSLANSVAIEALRSTLENKWPSPRLAALVLARSCWLLN